MERIHPADELERRLHAFEQRLWRGLVVARVVLPLAMLCSLAAGALGGFASGRAALVWLLLAGWTGATTPFLWRRLAWARRLPPMFWIETAVLAGLLFVGLGTRQWHVVHSAIPLIFCAMFVGPRATAAVTLLLVGALWGGELSHGAGIFGIVEAPSGRLTPSVVYVVGAVVLGFVPLLFGDVRRVAAAQREAADSILAMRRAEFKRIELAGLNRDLVAPVADLLGDVLDQARDAVARAGASSRRRAETLLSACAAAERALVELGARAGGNGDATAVPTTVLREAAAAVERARELGCPVQMEGGLTDDVPLDRQEAAAFRRLVREALANASKHGRPPIVLRAGSAGRPWIEIENRAARGPAAREGGMGLMSLREDARVLDGKLTLSFDGARVSVRVELPAVARRHPQPRAGDLSPFATTVSSRRLAYERTIFAGRAAIALIALLVVALDPGVYEPYAPLYAATASAIALWSAVLAAWPRRRGLAESRCRRLVFLDAAAILALGVVQGGVHRPWYAVSLATSMPVALYGGARAAIAYAAAVAVSLVAGGMATDALQLDLAGSTTEDPMQLALMCLTLAAVCAMCIGVRWAFDRLTEATAAYDATMAELVELERQAAATEAREETRRELHSNLCHSIYAAAIAHDGIARRAPVDPQLAALGVKLRAASAALVRVMDSLRS